MGLSLVLHISKSCESSFDTFFQIQESLSLTWKLALISCTHYTLLKTLYYVLRKKKSKFKSRMLGYKVLQVNKTNQLSIKFHLIVNFSKKFHLLLYLKNLNLCSILFFQNSNFNSSFSRKPVPQFDSQFKSKNLNPLYWPCLSRQDYCV